MKILEKLWYDLFEEECAVIDTDEERLLAKEATVSHKLASEQLTEEQSRAVENYVETLCAIHSSMVRKAFCKGCEVGASFLLEISFPKGGRESVSK